MNTRILFFAFILKLTYSYFDEENDISCSGKTYNNVTLTAYYPNYDDENDYSSFHDVKGKKLRSLQEYLDDQCEFITLAMDAKLAIPYGTKACIPELNKHYGHQLHFEVRDTGSNLLGMGYRRVDIFVRTETDSYDTAVNKQGTLIFTK